MAPAGYGGRVEGVHAVTAAADSGRVKRLFVERSRLARSDVQRIVEKLHPGQVARVDDVRTMAQTEAPQGVVAECRPIVPVPLDSLAGEKAAVLALDHVEDPQNVGAIARSAKAAGLSGLVTSARRAAPLGPAAFKAASGALENLPVAVVGSIPEALNRLKALGLWVVGLDASGERPLWDLELLTEPVVLALGAEGSGLSRLVTKRCDILVSIPMVGRVESLNASVSAALAAFEIMRVRAANT